MKLISGKSQSKRFKGSELVPGDTVALCDGNGEPLYELIDQEWYIVVGTREVARPLVVPVGGFIAEHIDADNWDRPVWKKLSATLTVSE